jgi:hypothetical protein
MRPQPNVVAFNPDVGEPILRRRYTGRSSMESFDLVLTKAQTDRLFEFWNIDCAQGALTFWARLVDGVQRKWWFDPDNAAERHEYPRRDRLSGVGHGRVQTLNHDASLRRPSAP